jgi:hypothetical protein
MHIPPIDLVLRIQMSVRFLRSFGNGLVRNNSGENSRTDDLFNVKRVFAVEHSARDSAASTACRIVGYSNLAPPYLFNQRGLCGDPLRSNASVQDDSSRTYPSGKVWQSDLSARRLLARRLEYGGRVISHGERNKKPRAGETVRGSED